MCTYLHTKKEFVIQMKLSSISRSDVIVGPAVTTTLCSSDARKFAIARPAMTAQNRKPRWGEASDA